MVDEIINSWTRITNAITYSCWIPRRIRETWNTTRSTPMYNFPEYLPSTVHTRWKYLPCSALSRSPTSLWYCWKLLRTKQAAKSYSKPRSLYTYIGLHYFNASFQSSDVSVRFLWQNGRVWNFSTFKIYSFKHCPSLSNDIKISEVGVVQWNYETLRQTHPPW